MKHELRKLEIDNDKLRQTLKQKLNIKETHTAPIASSKSSNLAMGTVSSVDEFTDMIREGFVEQM